jgi:hypothetical protein
MNAQRPFKAAAPMPHAAHSLAAGSAAASQPDNSSGPFDAEAGNVPVALNALGSNGGLVSRQGLATSVAAREGGANASSQGCSSNPALSSHFDPQNRRRIATGENKLGITVTLVLDRPLCGGCDQPLDAGVCSDCSLVFPLGSNENGVWL